MSEIALEWQRWALERLCEGAAEDAVRAELAAQGASDDLAARTVTALRSAPELALARRMARRVHQLEQVTRLLSKTARTSEALERRKGLSGPRFFADYYAQNRPVVLTDVVARSFEGSFSPKFLARVLKGVPIEVCTGRDGDPTPDSNWKDHTETLPVDEYVARVLDAGESNDLYLIANNRVMENDEVFAKLRPRLKCDARYLDDERLRGNTSLWIGPRGTATPLHHDTCNILFCQLHGKKRFRIAPPTEAAFLESCESVYAPAELAEHVWIREVVLAPGDCLFLPVGWWHDVTALDISVSLSFLNFKRTNRFDEYLPGARTFQGR
jgi:hypothetical protein